SCPQNQSCGGGKCRKLVKFSENFQSNQNSRSQCRAWRSFRNKLTGSFSGVTIKGSRAQQGVSCNDPSKATQICKALGNKGRVSVRCNGRTWETGDCGDMFGKPAWELSANGNICQCDRGYVARPCIGNDNWGGAGTRTCTAPTQTITVICRR
ncbi:MAG: hypothetical protein ABEL76_16065, partial [Bradymonadaceae bacterium]